MSCPLFRHQIPQHALDNFKGAKTKAGTRLLPFHTAAKESFLKMRDAQKVVFKKNNMSRRQHKPGQGERELLI
ncbi:hypothetical protein ACTQZK_07300 [Paraeggerthella sp. LCP19S3_G8]|uniref:hypothetical protein n=1 Tax=Paraeggerthella sp. LCP19S3_G8 TaxID=3440248 RepID=UPI003F9B3A7D